MAASRVFAGVSFCIRAFVLVLAVISLILILTAPGACFTRYLNGQQISREICPGQNSIFPMNADRWSNGLHFQGKGQNIYGQVALMVISLVLALGALGLSCIHFAVNASMVVPVSRLEKQVGAAVLCIVAFIILGGVETWYATGFDHIAFFIQAIGNGVFSGCAGLPGCQIAFVVKGWAVAAAFYFLSAVLFLIDIGVIVANRDRTETDNYRVARPQHY
ncbi:hypothetical protein PFISCL1PPCAC_3588 [Pristionchus fissidentatus]|uniref:Uncharacterized protein n=1 Tax=Pristionchus fissidentatus TaxID=1538716 RepID=A0AAV5V0K7_9BILA|nr:hypothetical protein PFISCL1PPCAC_3588 [Pristionchus fissidentatus]